MPSSDEPRLPEIGLVRLRDFVGPGRPIPIGRSTWWAGIKSGKFPRPVRLGKRLVAWRVSDIRELIDR
ncbi:MAG: AlpA family phage regulatory protein, partial [Microvirga sp.]